MSEIIFPSTWFVALSCFFDCTHPHANFSNIHGSAIFHLRRNQLPSFYFSNLHLLLFFFLPPHPKSSKMVSAELARNIVGIIGNAISFFLFASPMPTFFRIYKKKSVEQFKPDPYIASFMNCALWVFYGLPIVHPDSLLVVTINGAGVILELIYLTIFVIYAEKKGRLKVIGWFTLEIVFLSVVVICTLLLRKTHEERSNLVGILCVIFVCLMYASPLTIMTKVIKTKSVKYMPFSLSLANFLNGVIWVAYALIRFDLFILIGNGSGAVFGAMQLILYACYFKSTPKADDHDVKPSSELQLPIQNGKS